MHFSRYLGSLAGGMLLASSVTAAPKDEGKAQKFDGYIREDFFRRDLADRAYSLDSSKTRDGPTQLWPDNTLTYCFANKESEDKLKDLVKDGFKEWEKAGDINLKIKKEDNCDPKKHLVISYAKDKLATQLGFRSGKSTMEFDPDKRGYGDKKLNMAHELGHAFGFYHEHQRADAKDYVKFICENLEDYEKFKKENDDEEMKELCEKQGVANAEKFSAAQFLPYDGVEEDDSGEFDMDSIMRYNSNIGGKKLGGFGPRASVLKTKDGKNDLKDVKKVSSKDVERLNQMYHD